jgi:hypothetical protein
MQGPSRSGFVCATAVAFWLLAGLCPGTAIGDDQFQPNIKPTLRVTRVTEPIVIDGELDDPGWATAERAETFTQYTPTDMVKPPVETIAMVAYDDDNFYVAFIAKDDPANIRASLQDRDEVYRDDYVGILFDTFGNNEWYYELFVNPRGVQMDLRWTNGFGEDMSFDMVWYSAAKITDDGFQAEMAIPFASLRFPNTPTQTWHATFWWNSPRDSRRRYTWAAISEDEPCFPCQFGTLTGIQNVSPGSPLEFLPSVIGYQAAEIADDPSQGLQNNKIDGEASLGVKYSITSDLSAEATLNPDFSQVESDVGQIDVNTTFALYFSETRPFFQEGSDLFQSFLDAVYTRSINDPILAAKATGRFGRTSIAYIAARDEHSPIVIPLEEGSEVLSAGKSTSNVVRVRSSIGEDAFIGGLVTDRRLDDGGSGTVFSSDLSFRFLKNYRFELQGLGSYTREADNAYLNEDLPDTTFDSGRHTVALDGEKYWGHAVYASIERSARTWNLNWDYYEFSPTVRADNGFITRNAYRNTDFWTGWTFRPDTRLLEAYQPSLNVGRLWRLNGDRKDEWLRPELWIQFKGQNELDISRLLSREVFKGIVFDIRHWDIDFYSAFSELVTVSTGVSFAKNIARNLDVPVLGDGFVFNGSVTIKPYERLIVEPLWRYSQLSYVDGGPEIFRAYILRCRINYQFTRKLFVRFVVQYRNSREIVEDEPSTYTRTESLSLEPLLTYRVNPFTTFYLGSTHGSEDLDDLADGKLRPTSRQFFLKLQYLLRI